MSIISLFPLYWLFTGSVKYSADIMKIPPDWFPKRFTLDNFRAIFEEDALIWIFNSFFVSTVTTVLIIFVSSGCAYAISKLKFKGRRLLFAFVIAALILPKEVYLLPLYQTMVDMGLLGTLTSMILPDIAMPFGVFLLKQFCDTIPNEILEATEIEGCGKIRFFFSFNLPLSKPGIGALTILAFIRVWNGYLWQMVMATGSNKFTLPVGIASLFDDPLVVDYGLKFAGATVTAVPLLIVFMIFQKYFTEGINAGAVKG